MPVPPPSPLGSASADADDRRRADDDVTSGADDVPSDVALGSFARLPREVLVHHVVPHLGEDDRAVLLETSRLCRDAVREARGGVSSWGPDLRSRADSSDDDADADDMDDWSGGDSDGSDDSDWMDVAFFSRHSPSDENEFDGRRPYGKRTPLRFRPTREGLAFLSSPARAEWALRRGWHEDWRAYGDERDGDAAAIHSRVVAWAAAGGSPDVLRWAREVRGGAFDDRTMAFAAASGRVEVLEWLRACGCGMGEDACAFAARRGRVACLRLLREWGCDWDEETTYAAATHGHLECLRFAVENGCEPDGVTCQLAVWGGHLGCLKYLREVLSERRRWTFRPGEFGPARAPRLGRRFGGTPGQKACLDYLRANKSSRDDEPERAGREDASDD
jgi:hypothetical protein